MYFRSGSVEVKNAQEIAAMREVGRLAGDTLCRVSEMIKPGITTDEINEFIHADTLRKGARPAPLNQRSGGGGPPFPKRLCTSLNEVVCHGSPGSRVLQEGVIVNVDVTHIYVGFHGVASATFDVGTPSEAAKRFAE